MAKPLPKRIYAWWDCTLFCGTEPPNNVRCAEYVLNKEGIACVQTTTTITLKELKELDPAKG